VSVYDKIEKMYVLFVVDYIARKKKFLLLSKKLVPRGVKYMLYAEDSLLLSTNQTPDAEGALLCAWRQLYHHIWQECQGGFQSSWIFFYVVVEGSHHGTTVDLTFVFKKRFPVVLVSVL
jgi:hypothetical protein